MHRDNIKGTGGCGFWYTSVDHVGPKPDNATDLHLRAETTGTYFPSTPSIPPLALPEIYSLQVACIYGKDGKYQGMLAPEHINILHGAFDRARHSRMHD
eukprot:scaffold30951_cov13-Tisochrysis_lutea.AAC.1